MCFAVLCDRYHILTAQLLPCEDVVVKLAGCAVLRIFVDDWNFYEDQFEPFIHQALHHLLRVIQHCYDFDSQVQSFNVLCLILERMGTRVKPFASEIVAMIPEVWEKAHDQSLLKIQVLNAMHRMMQVSTQPTIPALPSQPPSRLLLSLYSA